MVLLSGGIDIALATAEEILKYAEGEFEKAVKTGDLVLYRNAVDKAFLSMIVVVNSSLILQHPFQHFSPSKPPLGLGIVSTIG